MADAPQTNPEIRRWYHEQLAKIPELNEQWITQNVSLKERAQRAWQIRHDARLAARDWMSNKKQVEQLQARDTKLYGNPDGPTFEFLYAALEAGGMEENAALEQIIKDSSRTNAEVDEKLGLKDKE